MQRLSGELRGIEFSKKKTEKMSESKVDMSLDDEEEIICEGGGNPEDNEFDRIVGAFEEVLMEEEFNNAINGFCAKHCDIFSEGDENKLEYTAIFERYTAQVEELLNRMVSDRVENFNMARFEQMIISRQDEISGEIFDMLNSLGDYTEFKELMLSHKRKKGEEKCGEAGLSITGHHV